MNQIINPYEMIPFCLFLLVVWAVVCHIPEKEKFMTQSQVDAQVKALKAEFMNCEYLWQLQILVGRKNVLIEQAARNTMKGKEVKEDLNISYAIRATDLEFNQGFAPELKPFISIN